MNSSFLLFLLLVGLVQLGAGQSSDRPRDRWRSNPSGSRSSSLIGRALVIPPTAGLTDELDYEKELLQSTPEIIKHRGFHVEEHKVVTEDGYILTLHRIPPRTKKKNTRVVFLQHGALTSDALWIISPKNRSLTFLLAERGYDVWMGNSRGSRYSREHIWLDPDSSQYWDFSADEMGRYDIPASLNYVLKTTRQPKLVFVGNSFGCSIFFIAMILHPELNDKVELMFAFAPLVSMAHVRSAPMRIFLPLWDIVHWAVKRNGVAVVNDLKTSPFRQSMIRSVCHGSYLGAAICRENLAPQVGYHRDNFDLSLLPALYEHWPAGMSLKTMDHLVQSMRSGFAFSAYSYGRQENLKRYGTEEPPEYDLSLVTVPVIVFWSANDYVVGPEDISWLVNELGNVRASIPVSDPKFTHFDFQFGINVKDVVYDHVLSLIPPP